MGHETCDSVVSVHVLHPVLNSLKIKVPSKKATKLINHSK